MRINPNIECLVQKNWKKINSFFDEFVIGIGSKYFEENLIINDYGK